MGIHTIVAGTCANCTGYGATYAAAGALMLVGAPAYTFLTERKIERKMAKLRTTRLRFPNQSAKRRTVERNQLPTPSRLR